MTESQDESLDVVNERVPLPVLVTERFCNTGFGPPCVPLKVKVVGDTVKTGLEGGGGCTVNVTVTDAGEPCVPADVTVRCPVKVP